MRVFGKLLLLLLFVTVVGRASAAFDYQTAIKLNAPYGITTGLIAKYGYTFWPEDAAANLTKVPGTTMQIDKVTLSAFSKMQTAAKKDKVNLKIISAFRSRARQESIIKTKRHNGESVDEVLKYSAPIGFSQHHTGRALDILSSTYSTLDAGFAKTKAYARLVKNAASYGFTLSYPPKADPSQIRTTFEPWHRYYGK